MSSSLRLKVNLGFAVALLILCVVGGMAWPDLIVLDLMMPEATGFDVVRELRAHPESREIPILIFSVKDLTPEERERLRGSVQAIVTKGATGDLLRELARMRPAPNRSEGSAAGRSSGRCQAARSRPKRGQAVRAARDAGCGEGGIGPPFRGLTQRTVHDPHHSERNHRDHAYDNRRLGPTVVHTRSASMRNRLGFTLVEVLIVLGIIGLLAVIAILKFANSKQKAIVTSMRSDLHNLLSAEEAHWVDNKTYYGGAIPGAGFQYQSSPGVTVTIVTATVAGWSATATAAGLTPTTCAIFHGSTAALPPATANDAVACN